MKRHDVGISARTGLVGLLGHPVEHSFSPRMHNAAFRAQKVDMAYLAFDVPRDHLASAIQGLRALGMRGANLTLPHKEAVLPLLDEIDPLANRIGAVNTIVRDQQRLVGYNTDIMGFSEALRSVLPHGAHGLECLVAGAGGAARAVIAALVQEGAASVFVYNRTFDRAAALCTLASSWGTTLCEPISHERLHNVGLTATLLVNATSLGLAPQVKDLAVPVDILQSNQVLVDLVYGPCPTALVEAARARGAVAIDGREMLLMQAASSYRLWTGLEAPLDVMRKSIDR